MADRRGDRRGPGPGGARRRGRPRSHSECAARRLARHRPRRRRHDAPPGHQPPRPEGRPPGLRHDRRLRHRRRRRVLAHVQSRLRADGLRLRPVSPADALRRGRGGLPQRRLRPHVAHGPAGPGEEHGGEGDRRSRRPRPLHRRPRLSRQRPQRHDPRDRGGRGRLQPRLRRRERRRLAGPGHSRLADAPSRIDRRGANVVASHRLRLGAGLRAPGGRRREGAAGARPRRDRRLRRRRARLVQRRGSRRRTLQLRRFGRDPRSGVVFAYATLPHRARRAARSPGGVQSSEDGGRTWRAANGSLLAAVREVGRGEAWGPAKGSLPSLGPIAVSARFPLVAYVGLRGIAAARSRRRALQRDREDRERRADVERRPRGVRHAVDEPRRVVDRAARRGRRPLRLVRLALRPRGGAERPRRRVRDRPVPHLPDHGRRAGLGAGQLRAARRRPVDDPRPRRDHDLRHPVRPARREPGLHPLHRHRPLPQRGRRRDLDGLHHRHPHAAGATRPTGWRSTPR